MLREMFAVPEPMPVRPTPSATTFSPCPCMSRATLSVVADVSSREAVNAMITTAVAAKNAKRQDFIYLSFGLRGRNRRDSITSNRDNGTLRSFTQDQAQLRPAARICPPDPQAAEGTSWSPPG